MALAAKHEGPGSMASNYKGQKKERPFYSHCKYHGHTVEKCYKLHGYPPGFKKRQRSQNGSINIAIVNQLSTQTSLEGNTDKSNADIGNFFKQLNNDQCH